jgi:hypothetical protein
VIKSSQRKPLRMIKEATAANEVTDGEEQQKGDPPPIWNRRRATDRASHFARDRGQPIHSR